MAAPSAAQQGPSLQVSTQRSTDGYYVLSWDTEADAASSYVLQESESPDFASVDTVYRGPDRSRVMSGKPDATYYYRLAFSDAEPGAWSDSVEVQVSHHSLTRAFTFFALGFIVFISLLLVVLVGVKKQKTD